MKSVHVGWILAVLVLAFLTVACNAESKTRIVSASLGTQVQAGKIVNPEDEFKPADRMIHLVVELGNVIGATNVGAKWYAVSAGTQKDQLLFESELALDALNTSADFTLTNTNDWLPGKYKVVIFLNGQEDRQLNFEVE